MRASGLIAEDEYAEDEQNPDFSHMQLPVYIVYSGGNSVQPVYGVYPDW